jgi:hypothetical protein
VLLSEYHFDIVVITESWCNAGVSDANISGGTSYSVVRCDREGREGGGVLLLIKNKFSYSLLSSSNDVVDNIWVDIRINCDIPKIRFAVFHRPPIQDPTRNLYSFSRVITSVNTFSICSHPTIVLGDFNLPNIDWINSSCSSPNEENIINCFANNGLIQLVTEPTLGANILDLVFCSNTSLLNGISIEEPFSGADHSSLSCTINVSQPNYNNISSKKNFRAADYASISVLLDI